MSDDVAIKVEDLTKVYKLYNSPMDRLKEALSPIRRKYHHEFYALHNVSFEVKKGETVGIIGKNGSGKSTLLKLITGVLSPSTGSVTVRGRISALLELGAGFNPELTGIENVYFNGTLMGYSKEEIDSKLNDILGFADIGEFVYQPVKTYSSGMFVRLAFAVAINVEPDILIIDEALAVGDMRFQKKCKEQINNKKESGTTIILVSHAISDIKAICDQVLYLKNGRIKFTGEACEAISMYSYEDNKAEMTAISINELSYDSTGDIGGTGDILITNIICYQKDNDKNSSEIEYGKNIIVELSYNSINKIQNPVFRINMSVMGYKYFVNFDSCSTVEIDHIHGKGKVVLEILNPNLYPNNYTLNVGIINGITNVKYIYWSDAVAFIIVPPKGKHMLYPSSLIELDGKMQHYEIRDK